MVELWRHRIDVNDILSKETFKECFSKCSTRPFSDTRLISGLGCLGRLRKLGLIDQVAHNDGVEYLLAHAEKLQLFLNPSHDAFKVLRNALLVNRYTKGYIWLVREANRLLSQPNHKLTVSELSDALYSMRYRDAEDSESRKHLRILNHHILKLPDNSFNIVLLANAIQGFHLMHKYSMEVCMSKLSQCYVH